GLREMVTRFARQRLGGVVLRAVRRTDRRRARLDRLARRRDRDLARSMLLLERLERAGTDGADLRASIHLDGYDEALRRNASSGVSGLGSPALRFSSSR